MKQQPQCPDCKYWHEPNWKGCDAKTGKGRFKPLMNQTITKDDAKHFRPEPPAPPNRERDECEWQNCGKKLCLFQKCNCTDCCHGHKPSDPTGWEERLEERFDFMNPLLEHGIKEFISAELKSNAEAVVARFENAVGCGGALDEDSHSYCSDGGEICSGCLHFKTLCREIREGKG